MLVAETKRTEKRSDGDIFERYIPLVKKAAKRMARRLPSHIELDDLVSAGLVGLTEAVSRFDASRPEGFESYVQTRVTGAMRDELRTLDPLTRDQRRAVRKVQRAERTLSQERGRPVGTDEVADSLGLSRGELDRIRETQLASVHITVDAAAEREDGEDAVTCAADSTWIAQDQQFGDKEEIAELAKSIEMLPERLRTVLALYYQEGLLLKEIGMVMGFSEARACQLHGEAVARLRTIAKAA